MQIGAIGPRSSQYKSEYRVKQKFDKTNSVFPDSIAVQNIEWHISNHFKALVFYAVKGGFKSESAG
jgi:hypothetical protein